MTQHKPGLLEGTASRHISANQTERSSTARPRRLSPHARAANGLASDPAAPLHADATHKAYNAMRTLNLNHEWIAALQRQLGVLETGVASHALAQAIACFERSIGKKPTGFLQPNLSALETRYPELTRIPRSVSLPCEAQTSPEPRYIQRGLAEDEALRKCHIAQDYRDYAQNVLKQSTFMGQPVTGHPEFLARLKNAESWLSAKCQGLTGSALGQKYGIHTLSSFRPSTAKASQLLHGIGFAIDINPVANNWNFGNSTKINAHLKVSFQEIMLSVSKLLGESVVSRADHLSALDDQETSAAFDKIAASNEALKRYRLLGQNFETLKSYLESDLAPKTAKRQSAATWFKRIAAHEAILRRRTDNSQAETPSGFMDFSKMTIVALRDIAGLRWGGTDLGAESGDMMHFDGYQLSPADKLHREIKKMRLSREAAKQAEAPPQTSTTSS